MPLCTQAHLHGKYTHIQLFSSSPHYQLSISLWGVSPKTKSSIKRWCEMLPSMWTDCVYETSKNRSTGMNNWVTYPLLRCSVNIGSADLVSGCCSRLLYGSRSIVPTFTPARVTLLIQFSSLILGLICALTFSRPRILHKQLLGWVPS